MEESAPFITSIHASMTSWLTPTVLFILLNLMIATILFTSNFPNKLPTEKQQNHNNSVQSQLPRSPSILHRLKSLNLYPHISEPEPEPETEPSSLTIYHQQPPLEIAATQYVYTHPFDFDPTRIENENPPAPEQCTDFVESHEEDDDLESLDEIYSKITGGNVNRTKSDTLPASGELPVKLPAKMKKSASLKSAFSHFEEDKIVEARRPATVRERRSAAGDDDVEVDAKADDFINKFKHQLKLQRMDSIISSIDLLLAFVDVDLVDVEIDLFFASVNLKQFGGRKGICFIVKARRSATVKERSSAAMMTWNSTPRSMISSTSSSIGGSCRGWIPLSSKDMVNRGCAK
ncbi:hypothetical protein L1987_81046 [Smallanthus sonchifolius]|uniref:Uncharacterized protein n=1 Tax=Smallanthus sonchifolius TaxID=185202 RepID=A0ACB8YPG7_9ASTR|nr:hypothetical protein L1987_81046 [Smallanthus sonchifolius]